jgi:hypothetical protein
MLGIDDMGAGNAARNNDAGNEPAFQVSFNRKGTMK